MWEQETGFPFETLKYVYDKYWHFGQWKPLDMVNIYRYIHLYPTYRQAPIFYDFGKSQFHRNVIEELPGLASCLDEINWDDRLDPWNHSPQFPKFFTGSKLIAALINI